MKLTLMCVLLAASPGLASEREDRADIERVVSILGDARTTAAQKEALFTTEAQSQLDRLAELDRRPVGEPHTPWSEVTASRIVIQSIRFITPDVALVDAANTQYGSVVLVRRLPVLIVMKKEKQDWRIAALRLLFDLASLPARKTGSGTAMAPPDRAHHSPLEPAGSSLPIDRPNRTSSRHAQC